MKQIVNPLPPATELRGPVNTYRIVQALGQGSFGITYLATMQTRVAGQMGRFQAEVRVVVKEFFMRDVNGRRGRDVTASSQNGTFADYKRKFMNEAANLARLNHPNIVKVLERFEANNTAYYAMEYLDGGSLDDYIPAHRGLPEAEVVRLAAQMGAALEHMHANRMLHLDLKPNNIMRRSSGDIVLIDFGLSKLFDANGEPESSTNIGLGTKGYAAMEQDTYQRGDGFPVTLDVYAFGATLFKMLTGETPPNASIIFNEGFPEAQLMQRGVSYRVREAVKRAMAPATRDRYQSAREVVGALGGQIDDTMLQNPGPTSQPNPRATPRPNPTPRPTPQPTFWKQLTGIQKGGVIATVLAVVVAMAVVLWPESGATHVENDGTVTIGNKPINLEAIRPTTATDKPYTSSLGSYTYTGPIDADGFPHGTGQATFADGRSYNGPFEHGIMQGTNATFRMQNGDVFNGEFRGNRFYKGSYTIKEDGSFFQGTFKDGQPDQGGWFDKTGKRL